MLKSLKKLSDTRQVPTRTNTMTVNTDPFEPFDASSSDMPTKLISTYTVTKLSNTKSKIRTITIRLDPNLLRIVWVKNEKDVRFLDVEGMKEIRTEDDVVALSKYPEFTKPDIFSKLLAVVYLRSGKRCVLNLVIEDPQAYADWLSGLNVLLFKYSQSDYSVHKDVELAQIKRIWALGDSNQDGSLDLDEVYKLCLKLNLPYTKSDIEDRFKRADKENRGCLTFTEFENIIKEMDVRGDLHSIYSFSVKSTEIGMQFVEFAGLMKNIQKTTLSDKELELLFSRYADGKGSKAISFESFRKFMTSSRDNPPFLPNTHKICDDMTRPLNHYFVESSHNTYLVGNQLTGSSSVEAYVRALDMGCRCVELDCWDGPNNEPVIYHGFTLTTKILVRDVAKAISKHAFRSSPYPVIISLEMHCCLEQQDVIAQMFREIFGDQLLLQKVNPAEFELPSPEQLRHKIIVKNKTLEKGVTEEGKAQNEDPNAVEESEESYYQDYDNSISEISYSEETSSNTGTDNKATNNPVDTKASSAAANAKTPNTQTTDAKATNVPVDTKSSNIPSNVKASVAPIAIKANSAPVEVKITTAPSVIQTSSNAPIDVSTSKVSCLHIAPKDIPEIPSSSWEDHIKMVSSLSESPRPLSAQAQSGTPDNTSNTESKTIGKFSLFGKRTNTDDGSKSKKKVHKVSQALSDIVVYMCAKTFKGLDKVDCSYNNICSISEGTSEELVKTKGSEYALFNLKYTTRIYPAGKRVQSSNYDPIPHWSVGCQLVALNYQTFDRGEQLNRAMFSHNGGCGYVLKPVHLRDLNVARVAIPYKLIIHILSGQNLEGHSLTEKEIIDPYVEIEVTVLNNPPAITKYKTQVVRDNGFNPVWNEKFEVDIPADEFIFLRFSVYDKDSKSASDPIAFMALMLQNLARGYRHLPLLSLKGDFMPYSSLFICTELLNTDYWA